MNYILSKLFCKHKWIAHAKCTQSWPDSRIIGKTEFSWNPETMTFIRIETTEILICSECGKITKIIY